jgi:hypothetical protein
MKMKLEATLKRTEAQPGVSPWHARKVVVPVLGVIAAAAVILGLAASTVILLLSTSRGTNTGPQAPPSAVFLRTDTTTQGNWKEKYGSAGFVLANDGQNIPAYARIVLPSKSSTAVSGTSTWGDSIENVRGLQKVTDRSRIAGHWYGFSTFNIDVDLRDEKTHQLSLYLVDWDSDARIENIEVLDAVRQKMLDLRQVSKFTGGQYLVWNISGRVIIRAVPVAGANAVISGLFLD